MVCDWLAVRFLGYVFGLEQWILNCAARILLDEIITRIES
jgi:hypothetical protein